LETNFNDAFFQNFSATAGTAATPGRPISALPLFFGALEPKAKTFVGLAEILGKWKHI
jgi:hypothetical protein